MTGLLASILPALLAVAVTQPDRARAYHHYSLALQELLEGDRAGALGELHTALAYDPASPEIRIDLARLLRHAGRLDEALEQLRAAVRLAPNDPEMRRALALLLRAQAESAADEQAFVRAAEEFEVVLRLEPGDTASLSQLAELYAAAGDRARAAQALERYVAREPGNAEALLRLGALYLELDQANQAAAAFGRAVELRPESVRARLSLADACARAGQVELAITHYRQALERDPENVHAHLALGEVLLRGERFGEARDEAEAALQQDHGSPHALELRARALYALGDYEAAQAAADRAVELSPGDVRGAFALAAGRLRIRIASARHDDDAAARAIEALLDPAAPQAGRVADERALLIELGRIRERQAHYSAAAAAFARSRAVGAPDARLEASYVRALLSASDPRAQADAEAAHARFPDDAPLGLLAAAAREQAGDRRGALALAERLATRAARDVDLALQLAEFHRRAGRHAAAERVLRRACGQSRCEVRVLVQRAVLLERLGRAAEAETVLREALVVEPGSADVLSRLGYLNARRGVRVGEALLSIRQALQVEPDNRDALIGLGWALYRSGRLDEAEAALRRALDQRAGEALVLDHLGDVVSALGRRDDALDLWRRALASTDRHEQLDRAEIRRKIGQAQVTQDGLAATPP